MLQIKVKKNWKVLQKNPKISNYHVLGVRSVYILLSNGAFLDFLLIYALLSRNFYVEIYALFPQIFCDWKADSANFSAFRMYAPFPPFLLLLHWKLNWWGKGVTFLFLRRPQSGQISKVKLFMNTSVIFKVFIFVLLISWIMIWCICWSKVTMRMITSPSQVLRCWVTIYCWYAEAAGATYNIKLIICIWAYALILSSHCLVKSGCQMTWKVYRDYFGKM